MTGTISAIFNDDLQYATIRIWTKNGDIFEEKFHTGQTTFARVKYLAMRELFKNSSWTMNESENYKLISVKTKKIIEEEKTLDQGKVRNGDEFLLAEKLCKQSGKVKQTLEPYVIDEQLIETRTQHLPLPSNSSSRIDSSTRRAEFRTDLNRILLTLIETSQKLLWYRSDAEQIFRQAEEILLNTSNTAPPEQNEVSKLIDMGFTEQQAQIGLRRTKYDLHAAMELLLHEPDIVDNEQGTIKQKKTTPFYSHNGPFIPYRQFRQQYFQANPTAIQSLEEMGFSHDDIIDALRICHNNQHLACEYLVGNKQQQRNIINANNDEGLDPNTRIYQAMMENVFIQQTLNNPKAFFVMIQLYENPSSIGTYINDREIGNMLLQISRIYHTERYQIDPSIRS